MTIREALDSGRLETLKALRDRLASDIDDCESMRDLAALSLRLQSVLEQIDEIEGSATQSASPADEIAQRRRARELERGA